jgi:hypothetical protein
MFAKLGVRLFIVLFVLAFLRDVTAKFALVAPYQWNSPSDLFRSMFHAAWNALPWLVGALALLLVQRPLIRWLVPIPHPGCVRCGYPLPPRNALNAAAPTRACPECGLLPEHDDPAPAPSPPGTPRP